VTVDRQVRGSYLYELPGLTPYGAALELQRELAAARSQEAIPDVLVLLEHDPVVTLGTATERETELPDPAALAARGIDVVEVGRGGRATYHGPGQLVGYPILDLTRHGRDVRAYVERLERGLIGALADLGVAASVRPGAEHVGVWVEDRKIASIGVHVRRWITTHGFALNVSCDLEPFGLFTPCGLPGVAVTSVEHEIGRAVSRAEATEAVLRRLGEALGDLTFEPVPMPVVVGAGV
jgi:lipoate-protein ligase B